MVDKSLRVHSKNNAFSYIPDLKIRISNDESYELVKPLQFYDHSDQLYQLPKDSG